MSSSPLISVVIVNYNRMDDLRAAIASIRAQDYRNIETIVVDNASSDGSRQMLADECPEVRSIPLAQNIGMDGYSVACRAAQGEIIFQMDNDSLMPDTTVLRRIAEGFAQAPNEVAILATRVEEYRSQANDIEELRRRDPRRGPIETFGYHSGGVGFRRSLMEKVGYYNVDVFLYGAELFLQMKVLAAGYRLLLYPDILMLHKSSATARSGTAVYYETRNRYWLMRYYGTGWQQAKYLSCILIHDFFYSVHKRAIRQWIRAVADGFAQMPDSLRPPLRSQDPVFKQALIRIADSYSPTITVRRSMQRLCRS
jgi:GT2 family glycosyltransferase